MNLMLAVMFLCLFLGLRAPAIGPRAHVIVIAAATVMAGLYLFVRRFM
jgi:hypothetical protein